MKARMPEGFGGGAPSNMQGMLKQAQKMQGMMAELQEDLNAREYAFTVGGGMAEIRINGKKEILSITLKPEIVDPDDIEMLQDILVAGVNEAISSVEKTNEEEMAKLTGGMKVPGLGL